MACCPHQNGRYVIPISITGGKAAECKEICEEQLKPDLGEEFLTAWGTVREIVRRLPDSILFVMPLRECGLDLTQRAHMDVVIDGSAHPPLILQSGKEHNRTNKNEKINRIVDAARTLVTSIHESLIQGSYSSSDQLLAGGLPSESPAECHPPPKLDNILQRISREVESEAKEHRMASFLEKRAQHMYGESTKLKAPPVYILNGHRGHSKVLPPLYSVSPAPVSYHSTAMRAVSYPSRVSDTSAPNTEHAMTRLAEALTKQSVRMGARHLDIEYKYNRNVVCVGSLDIWKGN